MRLTECHDPGDSRPSDGCRLSALSGNAREFHHCHSSRLVLDSASPVKMSVDAMREKPGVPLCFPPIDSIGAAKLDRFGHCGNPLGRTAAAAIKWRTA